MGLPKQLSFSEICKFITFSHLNSINFNNNFEDNFMREKVNKIVSKAKTLNICTVEANWKWIHDDLILSFKKWFRRCNRVHFVSIYTKIYLLKVNNKNTGTRCEVCSKLIINNQNDAWRLSGVFIVYFEHVPHLVLVFLLLTSNM